MSSRRQFFARASTFLMAALPGCRKPAPEAATTTPGAPPAFGTSPDAGPPVSTSTFAEAEKLVQFELGSGDRSMAAGNWRKTMAPLYERRTGPRKFSPAPSVAPATSWNPLLSRQQTLRDHDRFNRTPTGHHLIPESETDIAFAPLTRLSAWIQSRQLTSDRLT